MKTKKKSIIQHFHSTPTLIVALIITTILAGTLALVVVQIFDTQNLSTQALENSDTQIREKKLLPSAVSPKNLEKSRLLESPKPSTKPEAVEIEKLQRQINDLNQRVQKQEAELKETKSLVQKLYERFKNVL